MKETKQIVVSVLIPISVELRVIWNSDEGRAEIISGQPSKFQQGIDDEFIGENCSDDDLAEIDRLTKEAFGIEDG